MGGRGSGTWCRWSKKAYLDDCRTLDINRMVKLGAIPRQGWQYGSWLWQDRQTGEKNSSIGYEADTRDPENAFLRVYYTVTDTEEKKDYKIRLERRKTQFNGWRWWFVCPYGYGRLTKLCLPYGADKFASRHAYGLQYASQSESSVDRALRKKWKIVHKTGGYEYPIKPKGMHKKTFERILDKFDAQEEICFGYMNAFVQKRWGSLEEFLR